MKTTTHIVQIFFDLDYPYLPEDDQWIIGRKEFFEKYTLRSLLNQTFKDFRIFLLCGRRFKGITSNWPWHERVEICYDQGREKYKEIETDYVAITRIDSDDLFHERAMQDVAENLILSEKRECLIFRMAWTWDMLNRFIMPRFRTSPPFFTHIFPRGIYKDWRQFSAHHFIGHGQAGGRLPETVELPQYRVCVVRNTLNVGYFRREIEPEIFSDTKRASFMRKFNDAIFDERIIRKILNEFAISGEAIT